MTCCTADLTPVGVLCVYPAIEEYSENDWVSISGMLGVNIQEADGIDVTEPIITVYSIEKAVPIMGYLYN
jgi:putative membrane protein